MEIRILTPHEALNKAFQKESITRIEIDRFKTNLIQLLERINDKESEEFHKNLVSDFLKKTYYDPDHFVNTKGRNDLVIHNGQNPSTTVGVILEAKKPTNKAEMLTLDKINVKAFQELVLYYLRERITSKNLDVKHLVATNINEWFIFDEHNFEKLFAQNKGFIKQFENFESSKKSTEVFYKEIAEPFIDSITSEIKFTYFNIQDYQKPLRNNDKADDDSLIALFRLLSPKHLLKGRCTNDSNTLDKGFYSELLHIIGLTEIKEGSKKLIQRNKEGQRNTGSILETAIIQLDSLDKISRLENPNQFGNTQQERLFNVALELSITWINRILFLKLLEAQLISYHKGDKSYSFLNFAKIKNYDDLNSLFFQVLARKDDDRNQDVKKEFEKVPYLNSSLFEPTELEDKFLFISQLTEKYIPIISSSVLKDQQGRKRTGNLNTLEYLFDFLNSYDFARERIQENNKPKPIINASVLGLIFEKINGYKDGSFFTPGFITEYMCRETIRKAVVQKFNEVKNWNCQTIIDIYNKGLNLQEANSIINSLKICDPAVGSGHFLVSALNEIIAIKHDLEILSDRSGKRLIRYKIEVLYDELFITDTYDKNKLFEYNPNDSESRRVQETLFHEKETIIENCLFGVDINPNSVKICRLRLWIELLKNAYYKNDTELETLPNIDINIKCGNSLISRYGLDADLKQALKKSKWTIDSYRRAVMSYRNAQNKEEKRSMEKLIETIKKNFESEVSYNDRRVIKRDKLRGELFSEQNQPILFDRTKAEKATWEKRIRSILAEIDKFEKELEQIKNNKIYENALEWRFEFPEVLNDDGDFTGFDVVIGNPPYGVEFDLSEKTFIKSNYYSMEGDFDSYIYFLEKSFSLLKANSRLAFIVPNNLLIQKFGKKIRELILKDYAIEFIIDLGLGIFEEAVVPTTIIILNKKITDDQIVNFLFRPTDLFQDFQRISQNSFKANENLAFNIQVNPHERNVVNKLRNSNLQLGKICEIKIGIECTPNYITDKPISENSKPLVRGRNFNRYSLQFENDPKYVEYQRELLHRAREERLFIAPRKIIIRQTGDSVIATLDENKLYAWKSVFVLLSDENLYHLNFLLALLNSKVIDFYYQKLVGESGRTFAQVKGVNLSVLPIKATTIESQQLFIDIVDKILTLKKANPETDTSSLEAEIDKLVYELYDLTDDEIRIVEGREIDNER